MNSRALLAPVSSSGTPSKGLGEGNLKLDGVAVDITGAGGGFDGGGGGGFGDGDEGLVGGFGGLGGGFGLLGDGGGDFFLVGDARGAGLGAEDCSGLLLADGSLGGDAGSAVLLPV